jgi:hypothetical protein
MRVLTLVPVTLLLVVSVGSGQQKEPPPGEPPQLWRASAAQQDGKIVIQIAHQEYVAPRKSVPREAMRWKNWRPVTLGKTVRAFRVDGKPMEPMAVLKALAEPKLVAVFVRQHIPSRPRDLSDPEPYYLEMLREGTIVLIVTGEDIYHLKP